MGESPARPGGCGPILEVSIDQVTCKGPAALPFRKKGVVGVKNGKSGRDLVE